MAENLYKTIALCPDCLKQLGADVYVLEASDPEFATEGERSVWMSRTCPEHGEFKTRIWPDVEHFRWLTAQAMPKTHPVNTFPVTKPCPFGCGTCGRHERRGTILEIEVTWL